MILDEGPPEDGCKVQFMRKDEQKTNNDSAAYLLLLFEFRKRRVKKDGAACAISRCSRGTVKGWRENKIINKSF